MSAHACRLLGLASLGLLLSLAPAAAQDAGEEGSKADAERSLQAYLSMWSRDDGVTAASVDRFYAPRVTYYGKPMSRRQVLEDKLAYIRHWPHRHYAEVPGTFSAHCNGNRSLCVVKAEMVWQRTDTRGHTTRGRARLSFDFVPADGQRKIAREAARPL